LDDVWLLRHSRHQVELGDWILAQLVECTNPIHQIMPAVLDEFIARYGVTTSTRTIANANQSAMSHSNHAGLQYLGATRRKRQAEPADCRFDATSVRNAAVLGAKCSLGVL